MISEFENYNILLVDDEPEDIELISNNLKNEGFKVFTARNGYLALNMAKEIFPDIILIDIMKHEMDGIKTCFQIRNIPSLKHTIIAFLTTKEEEYSQIAGFNAGGDDYIIKPVNPNVLLSRLKALLRRYDLSGTTISSDVDASKVAGLFVDNERYVVIKDGEDIILPKKEFELLNFLLSKPRKVFTREDIYQSVWGNSIIVGNRTIDVHIRKLRQKIGAHYIKTVKGTGYKFTG